MYSHASTLIDTTLWSVFTVHIDFLFFPCNWGDKIFMHLIAAAFFMAATVRWGHLVIADFNTRWKCFNGFKCDNWLEKFRDCEIRINNLRNLLKLLSDGSRLEGPLAMIAAIEKSVAPFEAAILAPQWFGVPNSIFLDLEAELLATFGQNDNLLGVNLSR